MALRTALGIGAGASVLGGILGGIGARRQAGAQAGVLGRGLDGLREIGTRRRASSDFTQQRLAGLGDESEASLGERIRRFGPARNEARTGAQAEARTVLAGARDAIGGMIRPRPNFSQRGAGLTTELQARRREARRAAPRTAAREAMLAEELLSPFDAESRIDFGNRMTGLGRAADEVLADDALRAEQLRREQALLTGLTHQQMADAGYEGGFLRALGSFSSGLAPGLTAALVERQQAPLTAKHGIGAPGKATVGKPGLDTKVLPSRRRRALPPHFLRSDELLDPFETVPYYLRGSV